jgi:hypothetical protein
MNQLPEGSTALLAEPVVSSREKDGGKAHRLDIVSDEGLCRDCGQGEGKQAYAYR